MHETILPLRAPSCEVKMKLPNEPAQVGDEAAQKAKDYLAARSLGVTVEKLHQMIAYAKELRRKFPHMKPDRVKRKVAEYFKVKLT